MKKYLQKVICRETVPDPDTLDRGMDPRIQIRIHTKMSWIIPQHWYRQWKLILYKRYEHGNQIEKGFGVRTAHQPARLAAGPVPGTGPVPGAGPVPPAPGAGTGP
jgi:hypothetical protein